MAANVLSKSENLFPKYLSDFFKPKNSWFDDASWFKPLEVPAVNVTENDVQFELQLAAPGMDKNDFNIDVDDHTITISAEKVKDTKEIEDSYTRKEYNYSSFSRSFTLPENILPGKIEANYKDGILHIYIPKNINNLKQNSNKIPVK